MESMKKMEGDERDREDEGAGEGMSRVRACNVSLKKYCILG